MTHSTLSTKPSKTKQKLSSRHEPPLYPSDCYNMEHDEIYSEEDLQPDYMANEYAENYVDRWGVLPPELLMGI